MKIKLEVDTVRLPKHPQWKKDGSKSFKKGKIVEVDDALGRRLVGEKRASFVNANDKPKGPLDTENAGAAARG